MRFWNEVRQLRALPQVQQQHLRNLAEPAVEMLRAKATDDQVRNTLRRTLATHEPLEVVMALAKSIIDDPDATRAIASYDKAKKLLGTVSVVEATVGLMGVGITSEQAEQMIQDVQQDLLAASGGPIRRTMKHLPGTRRKWMGSAMIALAAGLIGCAMGNWFRDSGTQMLGALLTLWGVGQLVVGLVASVRARKSAAVAAAAS
jgi:hypothetical protein